MIDDGRIARYDTFYRNELGQGVQSGSEKKWENFFISKESGGAQILSTLKKLVVDGKVPNQIMIERTRKDSVIKRNVY